MPKSKNVYVDQEGNVLVRVGDELTPDVVEALGKAKARRVSGENVPGPDEFDMTEEEGQAMAKFGCAS